MNIFHGFNNRTGAIVGLTLALIVGAILLAAAFFWRARPAAPPLASSGLPSSCQVSPQTNSERPGMVWVPPGNFAMGADNAYPEEGPRHERRVEGFWMDEHEVTNSQFAEFVNDTGYLTLAERGIENPETGQAIAGSAIFLPHVDENWASLMQSWWQFMEGAHWRQPEGPGSSLDGRENHPVVHIAYEDALAYAAWKGHDLPTEAQFEYAAQGGSRSDDAGNYLANTWQGLFPFQNDPQDGFTKLAPTGCYPPNAYGLHDLIGNVWEWTSSPYYPNHLFSRQDDFPRGYDPVQPGEAVAVIKGGSFLCAPNYCMRYRPQARQGQDLGLGASHIGFRTVFNP